MSTRILRTPRVSTKREDVEAQSNLLRYIGTILLKLKVIVLIGVIPADGNLAENSDEQKHPFRQRLEVFFVSVCFLEVPPAVRCQCVYEETRVYNALGKPEECS